MQDKNCSYIPIPEARAAITDYNIYRIIFNNAFQPAVFPDSMKKQFRDFKDNDKPLR